MQTSSISGRSSEHWNQRVLRFWPVAIMVLFLPLMLPPLGRGFVGGCSPGCPGDNIAKVNADFSAIEWASDLFKEHHGRLPRGLNELLVPPIRAGRSEAEPYLKRVPKDPWTGTPYPFEVRDGKILLTCYGADRMPGGKGPNADISNLGVE